MKLTTEQLRVIFEEWCSKNGFYTTISEGGYVNNYTSYAWKVYQACYDQFYSIHISDYLDNNLDTLNQTDKNKITVLPDKEYIESILYNAFEQLFNKDCIFTGDNVRVIFDIIFIDILLWQIVIDRSNKNYNIIIRNNDNSIVYLIKYNNPNSITINTTLSEIHSVLIYRSFRPNFTVKKYKDFMETDEYRWLVTMLSFKK